jgi:hypothetical protein
VASGVTGVTTSTLGGDKRARTLDLLAALSALPAPENDVDVLLPDQDEMAAARSKKRRLADLGSSSSMEDAEEADARAAVAASAVAAEAALLRSSALRAEPQLPRPWEVDDSVIAPPLGVAPSALQIAEGLVMDEVALLLLCDAVDEPPSAPRGFHVRTPRSRPVQLPVTGAELMAAKHMVQAEAGTPPATAAAGVWPSTSEYVFLPDQRTFKLRVDCSDAQVHAATQFEVECLQRSADLEGKRLHKLGSKLGVLLGGYQRRSLEASKAQHAAAHALSDTSHKLRSYMHLASTEGAAAMARAAVAEAEAREAKQIEEALQAQYARLQLEAEQLEKVLGSRT